MERAGIVIKATKKAAPHLFDRVRDIVDAARASVVRTVNTAQVVANWRVGREIVEEEQRGRRRADYGQQLVSPALGANDGSLWQRLVAPEPVRHEACFTWPIPACCPKAG